MRNPKFKQIKPNYRKKVFEVVLQEGRKTAVHHLPFAAFRKNKIGIDNRVTSITLDHELGDQGVAFVLEDGTRCDFPADLVLYHCDPTYEWSPLNQLKRTLKEKFKTSKLSLRVLAHLLQTSPSQVLRLLDESTASKQLLQLVHLAEIAGYQLGFRIKKAA